MSKGSLAFDRMRRALLATVRAIPPGKVVETARLGGALNIPARHVAYMLSQLSADEADLVPWHRVIPAGGDFGKPESRRPRHALQVTRLVAEGLGLPDGRRLALSPQHRWSPPDTHRDTFWADDP